MTCRRDRLPTGVPADNLCKKKTSNEARPKAVRFNQPINLVQIVAGDEAAVTKAFVCVHAYDFSVYIIMQYIYSEYS